VCFTPDHLPEPRNLKNLRKLTADGPVRTSLDGRPVVIDRDGPLIEYPATGNDIQSQSVIV
jgi:hypothetical protein